jgi:hypothetical protein
VVVHAKHEIPMVVAIAVVIAVVFIAVIVIVIVIVVVAVVVFVAVHVWMCVRYVETQQERVYVRNFCVIRSAGKTYARTHLRVLRNSERTHVPVSFPHIARTCKCAQHETLDFLLSPRGSNAFFYVCVCTEELSSSNSPETLELRSLHPKNKRASVTYFSNNLRALDFLRC